MNMVEIRDDVLALVNRHRITMPHGFIMLGRGLVTIEGVVSTVSPEINLLQIMVNYLPGKFLNRSDFSGEPRKNWNLLYWPGGRALNIPSQVSEFLQMSILYCIQDVHFLFSLNTLRHDCGHPGKSALIDLPHHSFYFNL